MKKLTRQEYMDGLNKLVQQGTETVVEAEIYRRSQELGLDYGGGDIDEYIDHINHMSDVNPLLGDLIQLRRRLTGTQLVAGTAYVPNEQDCWSDIEAILALVPNVKAWVEPSDQRPFEWDEIQSFLDEVEQFRQLQDHVLDEVALDRELDPLVYTRCGTFWVDDLDAYAFGHLEDPIKLRAIRAHLDNGCSLCEKEMAGVLEAERVGAEEEQKLAARLGNN